MTHHRAPSTRCATKLTVISNEILGYIQILIRHATPPPRPTHPDPKLSLFPVLNSLDNHGLGLLRLRVTVADSR